MKKAFTLIIFFRMLVFLTPLMCMEVSEPNAHNMIAWQTNPAALHLVTALLDMSLEELQNHFQQDASADVEADDNSVSFANRIQSLRTAKKAIQDTISTQLPSAFISELPTEESWPELTREEIEHLECTLEHEAENLEYLLKELLNVLKMDCEELAEAALVGEKIWPHNASKVVELCDQYVANYNQFNKKSKPLLKHYQKELALDKKELQAVQNELEERNEQPASLCILY